MPRIDPQQLLTCLTPLLAQNGGIKSAGEVIRLANLMEKYSKKLVSKCIYIQILKCTETDLLGQFMAAGGWNLVHNWLRDGAESNNWAFIQELLEMLLLCPVDGTRLKSNHTPKIVKTLSISCEDQTVKILTSKLVEQWLRIAHLEKQQLAAVQENGNVESLPESNGITETKSEEEIVKTEKKISENVKYKINNKEGSGKLLLTLKRSTSPSIDEKDAKVSKTTNENKGKLKNSEKSEKLTEKSEKSEKTEKLNEKEKEKSEKDKEKSSEKHEKSEKDKKSSSSSSSHRSSSKSSHRDKDHKSSHHKSSSSRDKDKHSSSSSHRSSSSKSSSSRDKDRDRKKDDKDKEKEKSEKSQAEKDKETLDFLTSKTSSAKLQRIPKRQHSENSENKSAESNDASPTAKVEKKKPSISIEVRKGDKPKTVKTLNSQFRNHGLAEEPPKPPSRKDLKKPPPVVPAIVPVPVVKSSTSPPPTKKIHLDTANIPEREGGVKLIKPKPMIMESIGFMDALSASAVTKKDPKKRKRLPSNSSTKKDEPESPKIETKPLKFYKDTLEETEEEAANGEKSPTKEIEAKSSEEIKEESPAKETSEEVKTEKTEKSPEKEVDVPEEKRKPGIGCGPDGPPGVLVDPNMPRKKKRPIRWRSEEELTEIRYFELDENERVNVTKTFTEQKQIEHGEERNSFRLGQRLASEDTMVEQTKWRPLIPIDNILQFEYGSKSREILIQAEREKNVLQELYLGSTFNESPKEPDHENYEHIEPQTIPLEDVTGNPDSVTNFTDIPWPTPKGELPSTFSTNAFANVFSGVNIPSGIGIPPAVGISNPLVAFANPPNPIITPPWIVQQPSFMQPPPNMHQGPPGFGNRGMNHNNNNFRNNNRPYNNSGGGGGNWVRGNSRRGICNQFQRTGVCRNKSCPYIHER